MIARWMLASLLFTTLAGVAALGAERLLRLLGRQARFPWLLALAVSLAWPFVAPFVMSVAPEAVGASVVIGPVTSIAAAPVNSQVEWLARAEQALLALWAGSTVLLLARIVRAARVLRRVRETAAVATVDGEQVLVADALGPAVLGLREPRVVVPAWLLGLDESLRVLVLRHEREHCRANDPYLVWLSALATALVPWNGAMWWLSRRLRLAMEIDCDARVMRLERDPSRYSKLLLLLTQREAAAGFVPMLANSHSNLGRRIRAMNSHPVRHRTLRVIGALVVAAGAAAVACSPRIAGNLTGPAPAAAAKSADEGASVAPGTKPGEQPAFDFQTDRPATFVAGSAAPAYPAALRAIGLTGSVIAQFVVDRDGTPMVPTFKVLQSTDSAFAASVKAALADMRFTPAVKDRQAVRQLVQVPFQFALTGASVGAAQMPFMPTVPGAAGSAARRAPTEAPTRVPDGTAYFDFQVEQPVVMAPGTAGPAYPPAMLAANREGSVLAQFVVDVSGKAEMGTFKVLKSDDPAFSDAVREALATMQFQPARVGGKAVRQVNQQPFQFSLNR